MGLQDLWANLCVVKRKKVRLQTASLAKLSPNQCDLQQNFLIEGGFVGSNTHFQRSFFGNVSGTEVLYFIH